MQNPFCTIAPALSAAAATLLCAAAAHAQVQLYGTIDLAAGQVETQPPGAPNAAIVRVRGVHSGGLQTSYFGLRGTENLGGRYRARFVLESFIRVDTGFTGRFDATPGAGADPFWSRQSIVALGGPFGEVRLGGNRNPTWITMLQTNAMAGNSVFSPSFRQLFNGGTRGKSEVDTALVNSILYASPVFGGVSGSIALQAGEDSGTGRNTSANISWRSGPIFLGASVSQIRHAPVPNLPGTRHQDVVLVGGAYDFGAVKVFGQYVSIDNTRLANKDKLLHFGITAPLAGGELQLASGNDKTTVTATGASSTRTTTAGYVYPLSKRTELYGFAMTDKVLVGTAKSYVLGVRHTF